MVELLPCPFCGGPGYNFAKGKLMQPYVSCSGKVDLNCIGTRIRSTPETWNRRAPAPAAPQGVGEAIAALEAVVRDSQGIVSEHAAEEAAFAYNVARAQLDAAIAADRDRAVEAARKEEREACAQIADAEDTEPHVPQAHGLFPSNYKARQIARRIRARGGTNG